MMRSTKKPSSISSLDRRISVVRDELDHIRQQREKARVVGENNRARHHRERLRLEDQFEKQSRRLYFHLHVAALHDVLVLEKETTTTTTRSKSKSSDNRSSIFRRIDSTGTSTSTSNNTSTGSTNSSSQWSPYVLKKQAMVSDALYTREVMEKQIQLMERQRRQLVKSLKQFAGELEQDKIEVERWLVHGLNVQALEIQSINESYERRLQDQQFIIMKLSALVVEPTEETPKRKMLLLHSSSPSTPKRTEPSSPVGVHELPLTISTDDDDDVVAGNTKPRGVLLQHLELPFTGLSPKRGGAGAGSPTTKPGVLEQLRTTVGGMRSPMTMMMTTISTTKSPKPPPSSPRRSTAKAAAAATTFTPMLLLPKSRVTYKANANKKSSSSSLTKANNTTTKATASPNRNADVPDHPKVALSYRAAPDERPTPFMNECVA